MANSVKFEEMLRMNTFQVFVSTGFSGVISLPARPVLSPETGPGSVARLIGERLKTLFPAINPIFSGYGF